MAFSIQEVRADNLAHMHSLLTMFGEAFEEVDTYSGNRPTDAYLTKLLASEFFVALVALKNTAVVGGLAGYVLPKFEQERREVFVYDLAVAEGHRREGIATELLQELRRIAARRGAYAMFIQADVGDEAPIAVYSRLGTRLDAVHFDIDVADPGNTTGRESS